MECRHAWSAILLLNLSLVPAACATLPVMSKEDRTLAFGCSDIVVIGRLKNGDYERVEIEGDLIGHGWISAELTVRKTLRGKPPRSVLPVGYFAHTYMRDDRDFMFVLREAEDGTYSIETAQLMSANPRLASHCE
jgi:hypothetical protein